MTMNRSTVDEYNTDKIQDILSRINDSGSSGQNTSHSAETPWTPGEVVDAANQDDVDWRTARMAEHLVDSATNSSKHPSDLSFPYFQQAMGNAQASSALAQLQPQLPAQLPSQFINHGNHNAFAPHNGSSHGNTNSMSGGMPWMTQPSVPPMHSQLSQLQAMTVQQQLQQQMQQMPAQMGQMQSQMAAASNRMGNMQQEPNLNLNYLLEDPIAMHALASDPATARAALQMLKAAENRLRERLNHIGGTNLDINLGSTGVSAGGAGIPRAMNPQIAQPLPIDANAGPFMVLDSMGRMVCTLDPNDPLVRQRIGLSVDGTPLNIQTGSVPPSPTSLTPDAAKAAANFANSPQQGQKVDPELFKVKMCRTWLLSNKCAYGSRCVYAHSPSELRTREVNLEVIKKVQTQTTGEGERCKVDPAKFKVKMCAKWEQFGVCPYSPHCMFAHGDHELRSVMQNKESAKRLAALIEKTKD